MKYLREFLESVPRPADKTDRRLAAHLLSVSSVPWKAIPDAIVADTAMADATAPADPCTECGGSTWLAVVDSDGARTCVDCLTGRTALQRAGVPI
jgi:hypothetical protein